MPTITLSGLDTQTKPMAAISEVLHEQQLGVLSNIEALSVIAAIVYEWEH